VTLSNTSDVFDLIRFGGLQRWTGSIVVGWVEVEHDRARGWRLLVSLQNEDNDQEVTTKRHNRHAGRRHIGLNLLYAISNRRQRRLHRLGGRYHNVSRGLKDVARCIRRPLVPVQLAAKDQGWDPWMGSRIIAWGSWTVGQWRRQR